MASAPCTAPSQGGPSLLLLPRKNTPRRVWVLTLAGGPTGVPKENSPPTTVRPAEAPTGTPWVVPTDSSAVRQASGEYGRLEVGCCSGKLPAGAPP